MPVSVIMITAPNLFIAASPRPLWDLTWDSQGPSDGSWESHTRNNSSCPHENLLNLPLPRFFNLRFRFTILLQQISRLNDFFLLQNKLKWFQYEEQLEDGGVLSKGRYAFHFPVQWSYCWKPNNHFVTGYYISKILLLPQTLHRRVKRTLNINF